MADVAMQHPVGSVSFEHRQGVPWVVLAGAVDIYVVEPITDAQLASLETSDQLYVDLGAVTFLDSLGVGLLLRLRQMAADVLLVAPPREVRRVLELCGVDGLFRETAA